MSYQEALLVNFVLVAGLILFVLEAPVRRTWARLVAIVLMNALTIAYVVWRFHATLPPFAWTLQALWPWAFFSGEMFVTAYEVWSLLVLIRISDHSPQADVYERALRARTDLPTTDVYIPSYSEGPELLRETIRAALELDYPRTQLRIWILDDSRRPWLETMCREFGVGYFARPTNEHGKAGNLNYAFPRTDGEYIVVIDADFQLRKDFLYRTLGFLLDRPEIAIVQTPQLFRNPDPVQYNLFGSRAWTEEQHFFMTVVQPGRDGYGNAFCVGSNWVVRRTCLTELGGFPQGSLCEDLEVSYALKGRGYRTLYLNEPLAIGLAPESVPEYIKQRVRWCSGTMQHAYLKTGPFRGSGLSLLDRLFYLEPLVCWLTYPFMLVMLLAPLLYWFTGTSALRCRGEDVFMILIPRFLAGYVLLYWLSEKKVMAPIAAVHKFLPAFHLTAALCKSFLSPFGKPFNVTAKGQARDRVVVQWSILSCFLVTALALLSGMVLNLTGYLHAVEVNDGTILDVAWSLYTLTLLGLCCLVCVERPKEQGYGHASAEVRQSSLMGTVGAVLARLFT